MPNDRPTEAAASPQPSQPPQTLPPAPIALKLPQEQGGVREFRTVTQLRDWLQGEISAWQWVADMSGGGAVSADLQQIAAQIVAVMLNVLTNAHAIAKSRSDGQENDPKLKSRLDAVVSIGAKLILTGTPRHRYVESVRANDPTRALCLVSVLCDSGVTITPQSRRIVAEFDAASFLTGRSDEAVRSFESSFANLQSRWQDALNTAAAATAAYQEDRGKALDSLAQIQKSQLEWTKEAKDLWEKWKSAEEGKVSAALAATKAKYESDVDAIRKAVELDFRLKAPVVYWRGASRWNTGFAWATLFLTTVILLAPPIVAFVFRSELSNSLQVDRIQGFADYWRFGPAALATFLYIWCIRVGFRVYLSFKQVAAEAGMRATMTEVFISLLSEKGVERNAESMRTLMEAMFRPISTGLVGGEQPPPTPHTVLQKIVEGAKS
ncbi:hypothetical protein PLCT2_00142 [Planctomycetaceae bacterium]|nr:hypothetical protein PLCT2_00142 [Planctomycetaceae bacterium]